MLFAFILISSANWTEAEAGITFTGGSSTGANTTTIVITVPTTAAAGDLLIAAISARNGTGTNITTVPAGWTLFDRVDNGTNVSLFIYYRFATAADIGANRTWGFNASRRAAGVIVAYAGVAALPNTFDISASTASAVNTTSAIAPSITPTVSSSLLVGIFTTSRATTFTVPGTMTERAQDDSAGTTNGTTIAFAEEDYIGTAATGTRTATAAATARTIGAVIALEPAAVSPVAYYPLNEASWTGAANEVKDMSGNNLHGRAFGSASTTAAKICNGGLFDGVNDYVEVADNNLLDLQRQMSITLWVRPDSCPTSGLKSVLSKDENYEFHIASGCRLNWWHQSSTGTTRDYFTPNNSITPGQWNHVGIVYGPAFQRIYINGVLQFSATDNFELMITNTDALQLGNDFDTTRLFPGQIDEVRIYNATLSEAEVLADMNAPNTCLLNHIRLLHDGEALTCAPETVTVQACQDTNCASLYTGSVSTTLQPTGWGGGNIISFTGGSTTVQLQHTTTGTVTLGATATTPAPTVATRCFNGATETCDLQFFDSGFIFDVPNLTACKTSADVTVTAVRTDDVTKTCAPAFTGTKTVNFWSTYSSPATGTQAVSINGTNITGATPGTGIPLTFNAAAQSTFTVRYPDAGQMQLNARYTGTGSEAGLIMNGNDTFVSVPVGIAVFSTNSAAACTSGDATCTAFTSAGTTFPLQAKAACWTSDTDTDLSDNPATPNFLLNNIALSHSLIAPGGGQLGSLGVTTFDMVAADNGIHTINESVSEVGVFRITATPPSAGYFGATVPAGTSANIGRFTPHHFALASGTLTNRIDITSCGDAFTYMDEPFRLDFALRAENAANVLTRNYIGTFAKLDPTSSATMAYGAVSGTTNLSTRLTATSAASGTWSNGAATVAAPFTISRAASPDGPYANINVGIAPSDSDGIQLLSTALNMDVDNNATNERARIGITAARFGRLRLSNAYGTELLELPIRMTLQSWNGTGFADIGAADSCTTFSASDIAVTFPTATANHLGACETTVSLITGMPANLKLTKPGSGNDGWVNLRVNLGSTASGIACTGAVPNAATTANKAYLRGNWGTATFNQDPTALVRFGANRSGDGVIFFRENF